MGAQVFEATKGFAEHLGKTVSLSLDRPGFIVNRILMPMINEAFFVLMEARTASLACVKTCQLYRSFSWLRAFPVANASNCRVKSPSQAQDLVQNSA